MAKRYEKLQKGLSSYENRPMAMITKQAIDESIFLIRGKDKGVPAWHYILVPAQKAHDLKAERKGSNIDVTDFGSMINYRTKRGETKTASEWGTDPPKMLQLWLEKTCERASVDKNICLIYEKDDIRLCTMQRAILKQLLGVSFYYYNGQEKFHYIELLKDSPMSLACRGGIKNYDRIIILNGINIEKDTLKQSMERFKSERHCPVQMLVCSPATYKHYKDNNKPIHIDLPTVQRLKPVYAMSTSDSNTDTPAVVADDNRFCAIQWEDSSVICIVSQSAVFKSPQFTHVNDICFIETEQQYERAKILFIDSYDNCEKFKKQQDLKDTAKNSISSSINATHVPSVDMPSVLTTLEQLPNELFLDLFNYLDIRYLHSAFWGINARFNTLFQSYKNLYLTFDDNTDQSAIISCAPFVTQLTIDTSNYCDFRQFLNLQRLILCNGNSKHLGQIRSNIIPNLTHLSFLLGSTFTPSSELVDNIFSNRFPSLRHVNLGRINNPATWPWSTSSSLRFVSIRSDEPLMVSCILASCPNLDHLQLHVFKKIRANASSSPPPNHPLRQLTLWSDTVELTSTDIEIILVNTPNVEYLYFQTMCDVPFVDLAVNLVIQLNRLSRFDCHVKETTSKKRRTGDLPTLHQLHPCFNRVECFNEEDDFRIFATK